MARGGLSGEIDRLRSTLRSISQRMAALKRETETVSVMTIQTSKRFRIAVFVTPLTVLGGPVAQAVKWSTPMPSATYSVDAACSGMPSSNWTYVISNQTAEGCTVTFSAPVLLAAGTVVMVLAVAPAS